MARDALPALPARPAPVHLLCLMPAAHSWRLPLLRMPLTVVATSMLKATYVNRICADLKKTIAEVLVPQARKNRLVGVGYGFYIKDYVSK